MQRNGTRFGNDAGADAQPSRRNVLAAGIGAVASLAEMASPRLTLAGPYRDPMDGFILGPGPAGRCDDLKIGVPVPYRDPKSGRWMMWYYCRDRAFPGHVAESLGTGHIALATSNDGTAWTRVTGPLEKGAVLSPGAKGDFDSAYVGVTDVIRVGTRFWMFYFGADDTPLGFRGHPTIGYRMRPGLAWSDDGITWTKLRGKAPGGAIVDYGTENWASWPNGLHDGEKFVLFYTTVRGDDPDYFYSHLAYSKNGVDWQDQGQLVWSDGPRYFNGRGVMTRQVMADPFGAARWLMVFTAMDGRPGLEMRRTIAAAVSDDLKHWRHLGDSPILDTAPPNAWDAGLASAPHLVVTPERTHLYYLGSHAEGETSALPAGIGLATGPAGRLGDFVRLPAR